ncbi:MAG: bifunctional alpha/beta hydrolase/class I SAM-dependent methyltransferase, partial [Methylococcales bacterium]
MQGKSFRSHDGLELFYRYWPTNLNARGAIVLFHRGHEHSGRMAHLVDELQFPEYAFFVWDAHGYGRSAGERGFSPSLGTSVRDVHTFIDHIANSYAIEPEKIAVVAQSVGAVVVCAWVHDYAPKMRCMVLASAAFKVNLYVPFGRTGLKLLQRLRGSFFVNSYVKAKFLTNDPERIASYDSDPRITRPISVNILLGLYETAQRIVADTDAIQFPTQLLISGDDWVVHHRPQHLFYERLGARLKEKHILPGFYHDTFGEKDCATAIAITRDFIERCFALPLQRENLLEAHESGFTQREADALAAPLPMLSLRGLYWATMRYAIKLFGCLSDGIRLGRKTGFDSGSTLDYVYRNQPSGSGAPGKWIDRSYL